MYGEIREKDSSHGGCGQPFKLALKRIHEHVERESIYVILI